jgi:hypothetical protein
MRVADLAPAVATLPGVPSTRSGNLAIWVAIAMALLAWQATTIAARSLPSLRDVVRRLRARRRTRWALLLGWAWLGWHTFVQGTWG